jgi:hypothetical protein
MANGKEYRRASLQRGEQDVNAVGKNAPFGLRENR